MENQSCRIGTKITYCKKIHIDIDINISSGWGKHDGTRTNSVIDIVYFHDVCARFLVNIYEQRSRQIGYYFRL